MESNFFSSNKIEIVFKDKDKYKIEFHFKINAKAIKCKHKICYSMNNYLQFRKIKPIRTNYIYILGFRSTQK